MVPNHNVQQGQDPRGPASFLGIKLESCDNLMGSAGQISGIVPLTLGRNQTINVTDNSNAAYPQLHFPPPPRHSNCIWMQTTPRDGQNPKPSTNRSHSLSPSRCGSSNEFKPSFLPPCIRSLHTATSRDRVFLPLLFIPPRVYAASNCRENTIPHCPDPHP